MKLKASFLTLLAAACSLHAQVSAEVTLSQEQFLPAESLPVTVRVVNRSGQTLHVGQEGWIRFIVESTEGGSVTKYGDPPVNEPVDLPSSKQARTRVNISPFFNLRKPGSYTVTAIVSIPGWNAAVKSEPVRFDIIQGSVLWEQEIGIPKSPDAPDAPLELRRYSLHQANYLRKQLMLYVQISDARGEIRTVFPVGPMLSFGQPEAQVDRVSNLHLLYQDGPRWFMYSVITPDGDIILRQRYDFTTRPRMRADAEGFITVVGGTRRVTSSDLPPPKSADNDAITTTNEP